jgi:uncharacterized protein (TIGR00730 family)
MAYIPEELTLNGSPEETYFLEGPHSRWRELLFVLTVFKEFVYGFRKLHFVGPCVTVFGSARFKEDHPYYGQARQMGREIAKLGFTVITGGGSGIMEAANRGAKEAGGHSIGCNIVLPLEQKPNKFLDSWVSIDYFFIRKVLLTKYSYAFVVMPGGYGTMDEFFEAITLIQTGKTLRFPVILMGKAYHEELFRHIENMIEEKTISPEDSQLFLFTDSIEEAIQHINKYAIQGFGLKKKKRMKPFGLLGEHLLSPQFK